MVEGKSPRQTIPPPYDHYLATAFCHGGGGREISPLSWHQAPTCSTALCFITARAIDDNIVSKNTGHGRALRLSRRGNLGSMVLVLGQCARPAKKP